ncbi:MAG: PIG-L deacetylase family protein [Ilumatobacteraceae bacterium]
MSADDRVRVIQPGDGRVILLVVAHADDPALFIGGTIAAWADAGWRVVVVRVTDDRWDSVGLTEAETIERNSVEFRDAAAVLGIAEIVEIGWPTDRLGDASEVALREVVIRQIRTHRPYALVSFDPYSGFGEDNEDHKLVAAAVDEAFWTSQFDLHHPEHLAEGLAPHGCYERWYFGRPVGEVTDVIDIESTLDRKIDAGCLHRTMLTNYANQLVLQARTGGWRLPIAEAVLAGGDVRDLMEPLLRAGAANTGARHGVAAAEEFRVVRYNGLEALLERYGER